MTNKKKVILACVVVAIVVGYLYNLQQKKTEEAYIKQNYAFHLGDDSSLDWVYDGCNTYLGYDTMRHENMVYACLLLYEHDTGNIVTLDDVKEYLSQEYEEDGSLRRSSSYPKIQGYIDYMWQSYEDTRRFYRSHSTDEISEISNTEFYKLPKLSKFEDGLIFHGNDYLDIPYCIGIDVGTAADKNITYIGYNSFNLPKEQVDKLVDWILTSGYMDMSNRDEWFAEHPATGDLLSYDDRVRALASGVKPLDEIPDKTWEEWVEQYNEAMAKASS